ncbi:MAG: hypothetical protein AAF726_06545 [Planctomycetota bacterium]
MRSHRILLTLLALMIGVLVAVSSRSSASRDEVRRDFAVGHMENGADALSAVDRGVSARTVVPGASPAATGGVLEIRDVETGELLAGSVRFVSAPEPSMPSAVDELVLSEGRIELTGREPWLRAGAGSVSVRASAAGYEPSFTADPFRDELLRSPPWTRTLELRRIPPFELTVVGASGAPIAGAPVFIEFRGAEAMAIDRSGETPTSFRSGPAGTVSVPHRPPFTCSVGATGGEWVGKLRVLAGERSGSVVVRALPVQLSFTDEAGAAVEDLWSLTCAGPAVRGLRSVRADADGTFRLSGVEKGTRLDISGTHFLFHESQPDGWTTLSETSLVAEGGVDGGAPVHLVVERHGTALQLVDRISGDPIHGRGAFVLFSDQGRRLINDTIHVEVRDGRLQVPARVDRSASERGAFVELCLSGYRPHRIGFESVADHGRSVGTIALDREESVAILPVDESLQGLPGDYEVTYEGEARTFEFRVGWTRAPVRVPLRARAFTLSRLSTVKGQFDRARTLTTSIEVPSAPAPDEVYVVRLETRRGTVRVSSVPPSIGRIALTNTAGEVTTAVVAEDGTAAFSGLLPGAYALTSADCAREFFRVWTHCAESGADVTVRPDDVVSVRWTEGNGVPSGLTGSVTVPTIRGHRSRLVALYDSTHRINGNAVREVSFFSAAADGGYSVRAGAPLPVAVGVQLVGEGRSARPCLVGCFATGSHATLELAPLGSFTFGDSSEVGPPFDSACKGNVYVEEIEMPIGVVITAPLNNRFALPGEELSELSRIRVPLASSFIALRSASNELISNCALTAP